MARTLPSERSLRFLKGLNSTRGCDRGASICCAGGTGRHESWHSESSRGGFQPGGRCHERGVRAAGEQVPSLC